jgi:hypothetical protein
MDDGLPNSSFMYGSIASNTSSIIGVVALWSKYILSKVKNPPFVQKTNQSV